MHKKQIFLIFFFSFFSLNIFSQNIKIWGFVTDSLNNPQNVVTVKIAGTNNGCITDNAGKYEIFTPYKKNIEITFSFVGYKPQNHIIKPDNDEKEIRFDVILIEDIKEIDEIEIVEKRTDDIGLVAIDKINLEVLPTSSGNSIEALLKTQMGVSSGNELSSQYNVRGGNYDENLVYVNDIQIYRPFLIRSGQQEGLSFLNSDLVSSIYFSAGGFETKYGDKMSSVLDINYKKPKDFAGSFSASLLGGAAHLEGVSKNKKFTYISGIRYKQSKYMLKSLPVEGDYDPQFLDFQTYLTYDISKKIELGFLTNIAQNDFVFKPSESNTTFGTLQDAMNLYIDYNGMERDRFNTYFGALSLNYKPKDNINLKFISSAFHTNEEETFDIHGRYSLSTLNNEIGSDELGEIVDNLGIGEYIEHARNYLQAVVANISHKGQISTNNNKILWGLSFQKEIINDKISEWDFVDSAGYSINQQQIYDKNYIYLNNAIFADNEMNTNRYSAYIQNIFEIETSNSLEIKLNAGLRATYWDYNNELNISPRASIQLKPDWIKNFEFRLASGIYYQPPFYREIRNQDGSIYENCKSQRSIHFVFGTYYKFKAWGRPFYLTSEIYYKKLDNLIPYEIDNVRIRYYANQISKGYTTGLDFKISGEFVEGVDSWFSFSLMQSKEDVEGDFYWLFYDEEGELTANKSIAIDSTQIFPGNIARPTDQMFNVGIFFQDYIPGNKNFKVHLGFLYGSPIPVGPPNTARYMATLRSHPAYLRADLGFSVLLKSKYKQFGYRNPLNIFKSIWLSAEVLNLLENENTISYTWITVVPNTSNPNPVNYAQMAVPNRLTGRIINLKLICKF